MHRSVVVAFVLALVAAPAAGATPAAATGTQAQPGPTEIDGCTTITEPGRYVLAGDVEDSAAAICIRIDASDVVLDGNGHVVDAAPTADADLQRFGVTTNASLALDNVTVRDLVVTDWSWGLVYFTADGSTMRDVEARATTLGGVVLAGSTGTTLANVTALRNARTGVSVLGAADATVRDATADANGGQGLRVVDSTGVTLADVSAGGNQFNGAFVTNSTGTVVDGGNYSANDGNGISVDNATRTTVTGVAADANRLDGVAVFASADTRVEESSLRANELSAFFATETSTGTALANVTVDGTTVSLAAGGVNLREGPDAPPSVPGWTSVDAGVRVTTPGAPVELTIRYDDAAVAAAGASEATLSLWRFGDGFAAEVATATVDADRNAVSATVGGTGEALFAVLGRPGTADAADEEPANVTDEEPANVTAESPFPEALVLPDGSVGPPVDTDGDGRFEDVTGDGDLDVGDVAALARVVLAGQQGSLALSPAQVAALDFDGDGRLTDGDVGALAREIAGE